MKAEELMIGDWVYQAQFEDATKPYTGHGWKPVRVTSVPFDKDYFLEPIKLTAEILEKNGFVRNGTYYILTSLSEYWLCLTNNSSPHNYKDKYRLTISGMLYKIEFVHQLQHALRLCGINKEIEL